jgi:hypothetical protein
MHTAVHFCPLYGYTSFTPTVSVTDTIHNPVSVICYNRTTAFSWKGTGFMHMFWLRGMKSCCKSAYPCYLPDLPAAFLRPAACICSEMAISFFHLFCACGECSWQKINLLSDKCYVSAPSWLLQTPFITTNSKQNFIRLITASLHHTQVFLHSALHVTDTSV